MGTSTDYRRIGVYSRDSAPGIIVAHGEYLCNVCKYLGSVKVYQAKFDVTVGETSDKYSEVFLSEHPCIDT